MGSCVTRNKQSPKQQQKNDSRNSKSLQKPPSQSNQPNIEYGIIHNSSQCSLKFIHAPLRYCDFLFQKFKKSDSKPEEVSLGFMLSNCVINIEKQQMDIWLINSSLVKVWVVYGGIQKVSETGLTVQITGYKQVQQIFVQTKSLNNTQGDHLQTIQLNQHPHQSIIIILSPFIDQNQQLFMLYRYQIISHETQYSLITQTLQWNSLSFRISDIYGSQNLFKCNDQNETCSICLTNKSQCILLPCRHMCLCEDCLEQVEKTRPNCPLCRKEYFSVVKYQQQDKEESEEI